MSRAVDALVDGAHLLEDPGIAHRAATDHDAVAPRVRDQPRGSWRHRRRRRCRSPGCRAPPPGARCGPSSAWPVNFCARVRPCIVTQAQPRFLQQQAHLVVVDLVLVPAGADLRRDRHARCWRSPPARCARAAARRPAARCRRTCCTTFLTGQPKLMSSTSRRRVRSSRAACAMCSGSAPKICTPTSPCSPSVSTSFQVFSPP